MLKGVKLFSFVAGVGIKPLFVKPNHHQIVGYANKERTQIYKNYYRKTPAYVIPQLVKISPK